VNLYSIDEMIVNVRESCFSGMVFTVGRLMRIEEEVGNGDVDLRWSSLINWWFARDDMD